MTLQEQQEKNWIRLDASKRDKCVWLLRDELSKADLVQLADWFASGELPVGFHHFTGTAIRNLLRTVVKDEELPLVEYEGRGSYRNWDDFYMAALRQAASPQEGEV